MDKSGVLIVLIVTLCWFLGIVTMSGYRARRMTASWIVSRLRTPGETLTIRVSRTSRAWNPAKPPGVDNGIFGPGTASYNREVRPDGDLIHLDFAANKTTTAEHLSGPVPESAMPGSAAHTRARKALPTVVVMISAPIVLLAGAAIVALILTPHADLGWVLGIVAVLVVAPLISVTLFRVFQAFRRTARTMGK